MALPISTKADPALLAEGRLIAQQYGQQLWPNFSQTAMPVLIVDKTTDTLYCSKTPPAGFVRSHDDPAIGCQVYTRAAGQFSIETQATLPIGGVGPVAILGAPGLFETNPAAWIATLLHEHFHQYQMGSPKYFTALTALDLANGESSANWTLNYPFGYQDQTIGELISSMGYELAAILRESNSNKRQQLAKNYATKRADRLAVLPRGDRRYFEFQLWQEGVARYTELVLAEFAASGTHTSLRESHNFAALAANLRKRILQTLTQGALAEHKRVYFYSFGAAEALVLDEISDGWQAQYFQQPFSMANLFASTK